jgi:hypothetical protein
LYSNAAMAAHAVRTRTRPAEKRGFSLYAVHE